MRISREKDVSPSVIRFVRIDYFDYFRAFPGLKHRYKGGGRSKPLSLFVRAWNLPSRAWCVHCVRYTNKVHSDTHGLQAATILGSSTAVNGASSATHIAPAPPELEATLQMLSSHRTVLGILVLSRATPPSIIRHSGVVFEGEQGKKYAKAVGRIVAVCKIGLDEVDGGEGVRVSIESMT